MFSLVRFAVVARHTGQNDAERDLAESECIVNLILDSYQALNLEMRDRYPLKRIYVALR